MDVIIYRVFNSIFNTLKRRVSNLDGYRERCHGWKHLTEEFLKTTSE
ncbi:MAG: hypothetical protein K6G88_05445 [Lachnospiraceae bacterium]|nr:hypothetical protein [Lachnospiraceae bacterium]